MKFEPKTEKEVEEAGLWAAGEYDFEVVDAEDAQSKKGNDMIAMKLRIYNNDGNYKTVQDWLLESVAYKLRHFAYGTGLEVAYDAGTLNASDVRGATGRLKLIVKPAADGYPAKNSVADYLLPKSAANGATRPSGDPRPEPPPLDDEIPF